MKPQKQHDALSLRRSFWGTKETYKCLTFRRSHKSDKSDRATSKKKAELALKITPKGTREPE